MLPEKSTVLPQKSKSGQDTMGQDEEVSSFNKEQELAYIALDMSISAQT